MLAGVEALANGVDRTEPRSGRTRSTAAAAAAAVVVVVEEEVGKEAWAEEEEVVMGRCKSTGKVGRGQEERRWSDGE